jgi:putative Mn2+ efflux pump MntP
MDKQNSVLYIISLIFIVLGLIIIYFNRKNDLNKNINQHEPEDLQGPVGQFDHHDYGRAADPIGLVFAFIFSQIPSWVYGFLFIIFGIYLIYTGTIK